MYFCAASLVFICQSDWYSQILVEFQPICKKKDVFNPFFLYFILCLVVFHVQDNI